MDIQKLIETLHPLERKVLPILKEEKEFNKIVKKSNLLDIEVMRALQWLENKGLIKLNETISEVILLDKNGESYVKDGLPETRFLHEIKDGKVHDINTIKSISKDELNICIGALKKKVAIELIKDKTLSVRITENGKNLALKQSLEEKFLNKTFPVDTKNLTPEEKFAFDALITRKQIIRTELIKNKTAELTETGKKIAKENIQDISVIDRLTKEMIASGEWKNKKFRRYDVSINVPKIYGGRIHPLTAICNLIRDIFVELGFSEMKGPYVETAFWCLDSMWIPQDHPARDVQDTFYLPYKGKLPNKDIVKKVKDVHEHGGKTGSKGYNYTWDEETAKSLLLRTHTTATTYRYFSEKEIGKLESAKFFYIGRVFRNEAIDATHLAEFHQVEGFVMADNLNIKHLMGYIKEFYSKMGIKEIKFKVTYNPYTEPSLEALYYSPKRKKWVELINSGIFRPESLEPYGIKKPVIAWGLGVERLAMALYELDKLKDILGDECDLDWLRTYIVQLRED